jgi:hypothetical protein
MSWAMPSMPCSFIHLSRSLESVAIARAQTAQPASWSSPLGAAGRNRLGRIALITR